METSTGPKYPNIVVELSEVNGNAFSILGAVLREMRGVIPVEVWVAIAIAEVSR